jgi:hypothetical protein
MFYMPGRIVIWGIFMKKYFISSFSTFITKQPAISKDSGLWSIQRLARLNSVLVVIWREGDFKTEILRKEHYAVNRVVLNPRVKTHGCYKTYWLKPISGSNFWHY